ncbi:MAG: hypothetical protein M1830_007086, partial [Pleopsidium flavum]
SAARPAQPRTQAQPATFYGGRKASRHPKTHLQATRRSPSRWPSKPGPLPIPIPTDSGTRVG